MNPGGDSSNKLSVLWAGVSWGHMGARSGMQPLSREVAALVGDGFERVTGSKPPTSRLARLVGKVGRVIGLSPAASPWEVACREGSPFYSARSWNLEREIVNRVSQRPPDYVVLEGIEDQLHFLAQERRNWTHTRLVGITHQPPAWWRLHHRNPKMISALDLLVVLSNSVRAYWEQIIEPNRIVVVRHGVDTEFFCPAKSKPENGGVLKVIFSGQWLRDFETLADVVGRVDQIGLSVRFDLVVPQFSRDNPACYRIAKSGRAQWFAGLTDEALRNIYQQADLLLMPLLDVVASNGLLESMASGLPSIITDIGGVRDYADERFADFVRPGDSAKMVELLKHYAANREKLAERGAIAREHAEKNLSWVLSAEALVEAMRRSMGQPAT